MTEPHEFTPKDRPRDAWCWGCGKIKFHPIHLPEPAPAPDPAGGEVA